jgi:hypothetical protein
MEGFFLLLAAASVRDDDELALPIGSEWSEKLRAAGLSEHGGTICCPIVPEAPGPSYSYRPERPFVIEGSPSKIEMMCRSSFMNTKGYFRPPHNRMITWAEMAFGRNSTISTTLPFCCVNGCIRRISPVAAHSGDRPLSEPTAGTQPCRREALFLPRSRPT